MSVHAKKIETLIRRCQPSQNFPKISTVSGYKIQRVPFEECASQEQENICNQRGEKLKGPCRWDEKCWDQKRIDNPATNKYSKPSG
uniref:Uncharacterized protein n=1 Tax=Arundo donax TaxID=35708 RepID=A0A0A9B3F9_ARUDO